MTAQEIIPNPTHAVSRSQQDLIPAVSKLCGLQKLVHEPRGRLLGVEHAERIPLATTDVGGGVRRKICGVNRDRQTAILQQPRRRQPDRSASENRHRGYRFARKQSRSQLRRTPRQSNAGSSMTVVVDDQFFSQLLGLDHKSRWPVRPQSNDGSDFSVRRDEHGSEIAAISGKWIQGARPASVTAGSDATHCQGGCMQELPPIHTILRPTLATSFGDYTRS